MNEKAAWAAMECCRLAVEGKTQSGKHVAPICDLIVSEMVSCGYDPKQVFSSGREIILPGWFRPAKKWDVTAYEDGALVGAIELKSMSGSFGNNANNRVEECLGSALDVEYAAKNHLLEPTVLKPNFGYVLIINSTERSAVLRKSQLANTPMYGIDPSYDNVSYIDRFTTMGERLLEERVYQAVWVATADLETGQAFEPSPVVTFDKFMANVKSWIDIARA